MHIEKLKYILKVAELGSISAAAKELYLSQPALSHCIFSVEKELQIRIFDRSYSPLKPTYEGQVYLDSIRKMVELEEDMERQLQDVRKNNVGQISIGVSAMRSQYILPRVLPLFQKAYPNVKVVIHHGNFQALESFVKQGKVDFSFLTHETDDRNLKMIPIVDAPVLLSVPKGHPIALEANGVFDWRMRPPINLCRVKDEPFILNFPGQGFRAFAENVFSAYNINPPILFELADYETIRILSQMGMGFAFVEELFVPKDSALSEGVYYVLDKEFANTTINICYREGHYLTKAAKAFIQISKECVTSKL